MSTRTTLGLGTLVEETILKESGDSYGRYKIKRYIKSTLHELTFIGNRFKLQVSDPSYKLRYQYALEFWRERTANEELADAKKLINELREKLNSKDCIYSEAEESNTNLDGFFSKQITPTKAGKRATKPNAVEKLVWYVTSKCEDKFYVKSANNCEAEIEISRQEILCSYKLIRPGDEVKVIPCLGDKHSA
ncbi:Hypothetical predicted protein, partial [Paramuricea clavata]